MAAATISNPIERPAHDRGSARGFSGAVVMGADYRALGVVRSLGRRRIPVWVIKQGGHLVAATSRYATNTVPWPNGHDREKVDFLLDLCARHDLGGWMLFPTDDYTVGIVSSYHEELGRGYRLTVPPWEKLRWACDKRLLHQLAKRLAIHQPWTAYPSTREGFLEIDCPFPVILKPAIRLKAGSLAVPKAWLAEDRKSLMARFDEASGLLGAQDLIVQELVPGGGEEQISYAALCNDGFPLASMVARRQRQYPKDFGQLSTYVETADEPQIIGPAERLLAALGFTGLVEIEFKRDPRNGQFKVLDINPRVWGWHTLSRRVGIDFPYLLWSLGQGKPVPRLRGRVGERWVHLSADLWMAIKEIWGGRLSLRTYLGSIRGPRESAVFAWDDPLPGVLDLPLFAWDTGKRIVWPNSP